MSGVSERRDPNALCKLEWRAARAGFSQPDMVVLEPFQHVQVQLAPWEVGVVSLDIWSLGNLPMSPAKARHLALALTMAADRADGVER